VSTKAKDINQSREEVSADPLRYSAAVTPDDSNELAFVASALFVGTGGNLSLIFQHATTAVLLKNVANGTLLHGRIRQVKQANTTASDIVALW
jgi:hypothetical protein